MRSGYFILLALGAFHSAVAQNSCSAGSAPTPTSPVRVTFSNGNLANSVATLACESGYSSDGDGTITCAAVADGDDWSGGLAPLCTPCPSGEFSTTTTEASAACAAYATQTACEAGQYWMTSTVATADSACTACATGTFSTTTDATTCTAYATQTACEAGQYWMTSTVATADSAGCTACATGTFSTTTNATSCTAFSQDCSGSATGSNPSRWVADSAASDRSCFEVTCADAGAEVRGVGDPATTTASAGACLCARSQNGIISGQVGSQVAPSGFPYGVCENNPAGFRESQIDATFYWNASETDFTSGAAFDTFVADFANTLGAVSGLATEHIKYRSSGIDADFNTLTIRFIASSMNQIIRIESALELFKAGQTPLLCLSEICAVPVRTTWTEPINSPLNSAKQVSFSLAAVASLLAAVYSV